MPSLPSAPIGAAYDSATLVAHFTQAVKQKQIAPAQAFPSCVRNLRQGFTANPDDPPFFMAEDSSGRAFTIRFQKGWDTGEQQISQLHGPQLRMRNHESGITPQDVSRIVVECLSAAMNSHAKQPAAAGTELHQYLNDAHQVFRQNNRLDVVVTKGIHQLVSQKTGQDRCPHITARSHNQIISSLLHLIVDQRSIAGSDRYMRYCGMGITVKNFATGRTESAPPGTDARPVSTPHHVDFDKQALPPGTLPRRGSLTNEEFEAIRAKLPPNPSEPKAERGHRFKTALNNQTLPRA